MKSRTEIRRRQHAAGKSLRIAVGARAGCALSARCPRVQRRCPRAEEPRDDQHRRRRRQPRADAGRDRGCTRRSIRSSSRKINFTKAPAPELPGKLKAMQGAGRSDIDLVLTGTDFLAAGIEQGVLMKVLPDIRAKFPNLMANYQPAAAKMQELAGDYGVAVTFMPAGPLSSTTRTRSSRSPTTPAELLAWCKANPNRLIYARPANSGPGRTFIMGLPYILGDKDPKDPGERLGQDLGVPEGAQLLHRVLPDGHRRGDEGAGRRLARHDADDDRLGHQPARARHRAEELQGAAVQGHDLGQRRALHGRSRRACRRRRSPSCST